jgi:hypothetical protein
VADAVAFVDGPTGFVETVADPCGGCRTARPPTAMHVFDRACGLVARWPGCADVVMCVVRTSYRVLVDLRDQWCSASGRRLHERNGPVDLHLTRLGPARSLTRREMQETTWPTMPTT